MNHRIASVHETSLFYFLRLHAAIIPATKEHRPGGHPRWGSTVIAVMDRLFPCGVSKDITIWNPAFGICNHSAGLRIHCADLLNSYRKTDHTEFSVQKIPTREKQTDSRILRLSVCYTAFRTSPCTIATIHAIHLR